MKNVFQIQDYNQSMDIQFNSEMVKFNSLINFNQLKAPGGKNVVCRFWQNSVIAAMYVYHNINISFKL